MAERAVNAHIYTMRNDHELDRYLLDKKQELSAKKRTRGSIDDPICRLFGDFVVVIDENGPKNLCRFRKTNPCPRCRRGDSK